MYCCRVSTTATASQPPPPHLNHLRHTSTPPPPPHLPHCRRRASDSSSSIFSSSTPSLSNPTAALSPDLAPLQTHHQAILHNKHEIRVGSATSTEVPIQRRMMKTMSFWSQKKKKRKGKKKKGIGSLWRSCFWNPMAVVSSSEVSPATREFNRVVVTYSSDGDERYYGFGEQFSHMDLKRKRVPIFVQEQGIGRGDQPITFAANWSATGLGGAEGDGDGIFPNVG